MYRDHRKGPGGPPGGATCPGGHMGCRGCALAYMGQGHQPQEAHAPGETLKEESQQGKAPPRCLGGGRTPPLAAAPLEIGSPRGWRTPPLGSLYIVG